MEEVTIFILGLFTSAIGVSVGGGGLILTPSLFLLGFDPKTVVGTTTIAYIATSITGFYKFYSHKKVDIKLSFFSIIPLTIGSILGALILVEIPEDLIKRVIGYFLIILLITTLLKSDIGIRRKKVSQLRKAIGYFFLFLIGLYKGTINSGTGLLGSYTYIYSFGKTYLESSGTRKLPWLISFIASGIIFVKNGLVDWKVVSILITANIIGGYYGAHHSIKRGNIWMKFAFAIVVGLSSLRLIF